MSAELFLVATWSYNISRQKYTLLSELVCTEALCARQTVEVSIFSEDFSDASIL